MDQCRSRLKLSENFERHWSIPFWGNSYGPMIGPYLFLGKFVSTNGPESSSKVSPYTGIGPYGSSQRHGCMLPSAMTLFQVNSKIGHSKTYGVQNLWFACGSPLTKMTEITRTTKKRQRHLGQLQTRSLRAPSPETQTMVWVSPFPGRYRV